MSIESLKQPCKEKCGRFAFCAEPRPLFIPPVGAKELAVFSSQMYTLLSSGVSFKQAMKAVIAYESNWSLRQALLDCYLKIISGMALSASMNLHKKIFPGLFKGLIDCAETTGDLVGAFKKSEQYYSAFYRAQKDFQSVIIYPLFVLIITFVFAIAVVFYFVPRFALVYSSINLPLPWITKLVVCCVRFISNPIALAITIVIATSSVLLIKNLLHNAHIRYIFDMALLHIPIVGKLIVVANMRHFLKAFAIVYSAGLSISQCLDMGKKLLNNEVMCRYIDEGHKALLSGSKVLSAIFLCPFIPPIVHHIIALGEETGDFTQSLFRLADDYEVELQYYLKRTVEIFSPVLMTVVSICIAMVLIAAFLPIYTLISNLS